MQVTETVSVRICNEQLGVYLANILIITHLSQFQAKIANILEVQASQMWKCFSLSYMIVYCVSGFRTIGQKLIKDVTVRNNDGHFHYFLINWENNC